MTDRFAGRVVAAAVLGLLTACAAEGGGDSSPDAANANGYLVRLDFESSDPGQFRLDEINGVIHIMTGPAGIAYQEGDYVASGDFRAAATFVQYAAPVGYREAYGVFVGGLDLDSPDLEYTYLLVRPTGDFLVKRRTSEVTTTLMDWTPHEAVNRVVVEGDEPQNTLAIEVVEGEVRFLVNATVVHSMPASEARPYGIAGIRANHRLDVRVSEWSLGDAVGTS